MDLINHNHGHRVIVTNHNYKTISSFCIVARDENDRKWSVTIFTMRKQFPVDQKLTIFAFELFTNDINMVLKEIKKIKS